MKKFLTAAFYKFVALPDFASLKAPLLAFCQDQGIKGASDPDEANLSADERKQALGITDNLVRISIGVEDA